LVVIEKIEITTSKYYLLEAAGVRYNTVKKTSNSINANKFAMSITSSEVVVLCGPKDFFIAEITYLASYS